MLGVWPNAANAQVASLVMWRAPSECPSTETVNAHVSRLVAVDRDKANRKFTATATVTNTVVGNEPWSVVIETSLDDAKGRREFGGATCQAVADATALFVALMLAPGLELEEQGSKPTSAPVKRTAQAKETNEPKRAPPSVIVPEVAVPAPQPSALPPQTAPAPAVPTAASQLSVNWHAKFDLGALWGALPESAPRVGAALGASLADTFPWAALELGLRASLPQSRHPLMAAPWAKVESQELAGNVAICLQPPNSTHAIVFARVCATTGLQWLHLDSNLVSNPGGNGALIPTIGGGLTLGFKISHALRAVFNARYEHRSRNVAFEVPPWGIAWTSKPTIVDLAAGIEWRL
jgi:hypothetical protein